MPEFFVEIEVSERDRAFLVRSLDSPGVSIFEEEDATFLRAPDQFTHESRQGAYDSAIEFIDRFNGAVKAFNATFEGVTFKCLAFRDDHGSLKRHYFLHARGTDYSLHAPGRNEPKLSEVIDLTDNDQLVARALILYGSLSHNWKNLYMVIEVIEGDVGGESALRNAYPDLANGLKLFKHAANNFALLGREARHAKHFDPPAVPMELGQAQALVRDLLYRWIIGKSGGQA